MASTPDRLAELPRIDASQRAARVLARLGDQSDDARAEALLVSELANVRWLTGFSGSAGVVLLAPDRFVLVTDGRYTEQARAQVAASGAAAEVVEARTAAERLDRLGALTTGIDRLAIEAEHLSVAEHARIAAAVGARLVPSDGLVEGERRSKDEAEIARIALACQIADTALAEVAPLLAEGVREVDVRDELEHRMRRLGASGPSYDTIVATGPVNASRPHHRPDRTVIEDGHTVVVDVGALVDGYHSDMTRTFVVGNPSPVQAEVYEVVREAQRAGVAVVRPGLDLAALDATCRAVIAAAGWAEWFSHGTGHGVGLVIHEDPFVNRTASGTLHAGDVVTVEPGVYRGDFGGVRIEDLVLVTEDGCRVLTATPKDSPCLPSPRTT